MRSQVHILCGIVLLLSASAALTAHGQSLPADSTILHPSAAFPDSLHSLSHMFVASGTDTLVTADGVVLRPGMDYVLFVRHGSVRFTSAFLARWGGASVQVTARFRYFPFTLRDVYARRELTVLRDATDTLRVGRPAAGLSMDDVFGSNLQKSGSIFRGFTVGTNRDLSLSSGLRLQLSGRIAQDIDVTAALTDENTPIQPEGTTQTLQEFDKVFVEIRGRDAAATLGDFVLDLQGTEFARLSRKLQGAKGTLDYRLAGANGSVLAAGAITRGKFNTLQFNGLEGVQGPYLLTGKNGERDIIVIAGTERVYVNGEAMTRGETNDYIIDYSSGEITFTTRRLVTAASRITVDYEYSDRQYARSLLAGQTRSAFLGSAVNLSFTYLREADDPNAPIDLVLTDSTRDVIAHAGADRDKAVISGVTRVDSNGYYVRVDTLVAGSGAVTFYRYAPGDPNAHYAVSFSRVGAGKGEYVRRQVGVYEWRGAGQGDYAPLRYLPLPQLQQMMDVALDVRPVSTLRLSGEFAGTSFDPNRLSLQSVASNGKGITFTGEWTPRRISLGGANLGDLDLTFRGRSTDSRFQPLDRTTDIEYGRKWGIDSLVTTAEQTQEGILRYRPDSLITIGGSYGRNSRGESFRSTRNEGNVAVKNPSLFLADYTIESIRSHDSVSASSWLRQRGAVQRTWGFVTPRFQYESEKRTYRSGAIDVLPGSFAFDAYSGGLSLAPLGPLSISADLGWRTDDQALSGALVRESRSLTQTYAARLSEWHALSSQVDVTLRTRTYSRDFHLQGNPDVKSVLFRNQTRYAPLNRGVETELVYEVTTERSARLQRVFVRVTVGNGNYRYLGDLNGNGLADDNEFVPARFDGDYVAMTVPTEDLVPVIDLRTGMRVRVTPARFVHADGPAGVILAALSTETYFRVEEKSTDRDLAQIYLLHFSHFLRDSTTLAGSRLFTQDISVLDGNPLFSARMRYSDRKGLNNLGGGLERTYLRERSLRLRWQLIPEISNQLDVVNRTDRLGTTAQSTRTHDIVADAMTLDFAYRPEPDLELGWKIDISRSVDSAPGDPVTADVNAQTLRGVLAFRGAGQARVEMGREELQLSRTPEVFPYELTGGRIPGKTWVWRAGFDYRVTTFLQTSVSYDGRAEGGNTPVHTARAEVKAFF